MMVVVVVVVVVMMMMMMMIIIIIIIIIIYEIQFWKLLTFDANVRTYICMILIYMKTSNVHFEIIHGGLAEFKRVDVDDLPLRFLYRIEQVKCSFLKVLTRISVASVCHCCPQNVGCRFEGAHRMPDAQCTLLFTVEKSITLFTASTWGNFKYSNSFNFIYLYVDVSIRDVKR
jgi:hypothetical protein